LPWLCLLGRAPGSISSLSCIFYATGYPIHLWPKKYELVYRIPSGVPICPIAVKATPALCSDPAVINRVYRWGATFIWWIMCSHAHPLPPRLPTIHNFNRRILSLYRNPLSSFFCMIPLYYSVC
jgi:hypothetical protein